MSAYEHVEPSICELMQKLRDMLDADGIEWHDASEELRGGIEIASCVWGYSVHDGIEMGITYGWPEMIESMDDENAGNPEPRTVEDILRVVKGQR